MGDHSAIFYGEGDSKLTETDKSKGIPQTFSLVQGEEVSGS